MGEKRESLTKGSVAHLIVILQIDDKLFAPHVVGGCTVMALVIGRIATIEIEAMLQYVAELRERTKILVVAGSLTRE